MKRILLALLALALAPIFVPSLAAPAKAQDKLVVSIWGGSWRDLIAETVAKKFTAETGVAVEFITGGTIDRLNKEKLAKGSPESDITFTTSHVGWLYANDGLFEQLGWPMTICGRTRLRHQSSPRRRAETAADQSF